MACGMMEYDPVWPQAAIHAKCIGELSKYERLVESMGFKILVFRIS